MKQLKIEFKPAFAILLTLLCFAYFFVKGVDNGIMVLASFAAKHYFDSTNSSVVNNKKMFDSISAKNEGTTPTP